MYDKLCMCVFVCILCIYIYIYIYIYVCVCVCVCVTLDHKISHYVDPYNVFLAIATNIPSDL